MTTPNIPADKAQAILAARHHKDQMEGDGAVGCFDAAAAVEELRDAGLLAPAAPEPRIIRTFDELAALDRDTVLLDVHEVRMSAREWMEDYAIGAEGIFPLAIIATGDQARAARHALEAHDD